MKIFTPILLTFFFFLYGSLQVHAQQEESIIDNSKIVYEFQTENSFNQFHLPTVSIADLSKADLETLKFHKTSLESKIEVARQSDVDISPLQVQLKKLTDAIELK